MIAIIIILAYIGNIFITRGVNKIVYKKDIGYILPWTWFIPIIPILALLMLLLVDYCERQDNWFTGKYW